jgi:twitching motility protein PilT
LSQLPQLLRYLDREDISEIVVQTGKAPAVRMGGEYRPLGKTPVTTQQVEALLVGTPLATMLPQGDSGGTPIEVTLYERPYTVRIARRGPAVQLRIEQAGRPSRASEMPSSPQLDHLRGTQGTTDASVARPFPQQPAARPSDGVGRAVQPPAARPSDGSVARPLPAQPPAARPSDGSVARPQPARPQATRDAHRAVTRPVIPEDERPTMYGDEGVPKERQRATVATPMNAREIMGQSPAQPGPRPSPASPVSPGPAATPIAPPVAASAPVAQHTVSPATVRRPEISVGGAMTAFEALIVETLSRKGSDLHVIADRPPLIRSTGELVAAGPPLSSADVEQMLLPLLNPEQRATLDKLGYIDFGFDSGVSRLRANVSRQRSGLKGSFRIVMSPTPTLESLGLPRELARVTTYHQGLVVIAGPNGHGKTTTLAAIVDLINASKPHHILTVEDPVEFIHIRKKALMTQREVGPHTKSFGTALKASLREDPDVIVIGELRDRETVEIALTAAETGHLVMATMSTPSAAKTIDRLIDLFPPDDQSQVRATLAGALKFIVAQRLIPSAQGGEFVAAVELLTGVPPLWALIRDNKLFQLPNLQQRGRAYGMIRMDDSLLELVRAEKITEEMGLKFAEGKKEFQVALRAPAAAATPLPVQPSPAAAQAPNKGLQDIKSRMGGLFGKKELSVPAIDALFDQLLEMGGSDLHLSPNYPPMFRLKGDLVPGAERLISAAEVERFLYEILTPEQRAHFDRNRDLDFAYSYGQKARFRGNYMYKTTGIGGVFRTIPTKILSLDQLGVPAGIRKLCELRSGLVLVTGPTGSGKSTTLAAMIDHINSTRNGHILTIEDPVEFVHQSKKCQVTHREVGDHTPSFVDAIRSAGRENADIILVGELRGAETMKLALQLASFGILIFATVHTNSAGATIDRFVNAFPAEQQPQIRGMLSDSLAGVVAQQLLKKADGGGRVAVQEILIGNQALSAVIREGKTSQVTSLIQSGMAEGMQTMDGSLEKLVREGTIKAHDALEKALDKESFAKLPAVAKEIGAAGLA